jgi:hypothetical protein
MGAVQGAYVCENNFKIVRIDITLEKENRFGINTKMMVQSTWKAIGISVSTPTPRAWAEWKKMRWLVLRAVYWAMYKQAIFDRISLSKIFADKRSVLKKVKLSSVSTTEWEAHINQENMNFELCTKLVIPSDIDVVGRVEASSGDARTGTYRFTVDSLKLDPATEPRSISEDTTADVLIIQFDLGVAGDKIMELKDINTLNIAIVNSVTSASMAKPEKSFASRMIDRGKSALSFQKVVKDIIQKTLGNEEQVSETLDN